MRSLFNGSRWLVLGAIFVLYPAAYADPAPEFIEVPPDNTRDNLLTRWRKPVYPFAAFEQKVMGEVTIEFDPDKHGGLTNTRIVNAVPAGVFDAAVLKTLNWWTIVPFRAAGCHSSFPRTRVTIYFTIKNGISNVSLSKPMPLADATLKSSTVENDASKSVSQIDGAGSARKSTLPVLGWIGNPQPDYPMQNNKLYPLPGDVAANITIQPDGAVSAVQITFSAPHPAFGEEVENAAKTWRAQTISGKPAEKTVTVCQHFKFRPAS